MRNIHSVAIYLCNVDYYKNILIHLLYWILITIGEHLQVTSIDQTKMVDTYTF